MTPEAEAWFNSLGSTTLTNCRARVTTRHGKMFAIEVWDEELNYYFVRAALEGDNQ